MIGRQAGAFSFESLVGESAPIRQAIGAARKVAASRLTTVLIVGETGTGKELIARGIHCAGRAAAAPFVAINCAAIPDTLLESELFGHEAGAFTDARTRKLGLMELAGCGTLFLDEVHQLPAALQPKLLRVLEERRMRRLGGTQEITIDCRVIAATNLSLEHAVQQGTFREDLYYRLDVFRVDLPALRDREGDIERLARFFLDSLCREHGLPTKALLPDAVERLRGHSWPGNVRELKNVIERAALLSGDERTVGGGHVIVERRTPLSAPATGRATPSATPPTGVGITIPAGGKTLQEIEWEAVQLTLGLTHGNQSQAARLLGVSRPTIARILRTGGGASHPMEAAS
jgi:transcriptional regulator with PAS, ATPase and Fis domain